MAYLMVFVLLFAIAPVSGVAQDESQIFSKDLWQKQLKKGQAFIRHLGHSCFAVRTSNHLLIFDYTNNLPIKVSPEEIKDKNVVVFVTHRHQDHFDPSISSWRDVVKKIKFVVSSDVPLKADCTKLNPNEQKQINQLKVETIKSTDAGVGFLVTVDGLTIFHAGDHALWHKTSERVYKDEINKITKHKIDLAFLPTHRGDGQINESLQTGVMYAIEKLSPVIAMPMHYPEGAQFDWLVEEVKEKKLRTNIIVAATDETYIYPEKKENEVCQKPNHCHNIHIEAVGTCGSCGKEIPNGCDKYCAACAKKLGTCQLCGKKIK